MLRLILVVCLLFSVSAEAAVFPGQTGIAYMIDANNPNIGLNLHVKSGTGQGVCDAAAVAYPPYPTLTFEAGFGLGFCDYGSRIWNVTESPVTCTSPQIFDDKTGTCIDNPCPAGQVTSSGWYDVGTDSAAMPPTSTCESNGCSSTFEGPTGSGYSSVAGVNYYFIKGSYAYDGWQQCTVGSPAPGASSNPTTTTGSGTSSGTGTNTGSTGSGTGTGTGTGTSGGTNGTGTGISGTGTTLDCALTPSDPLCGSSTSTGSGTTGTSTGTGGTGSGTGTATTGGTGTTTVSPGTAATISGLYSPNGSYTNQTLAGVFTGFFDVVKASPIMSAASGFFTVSIPAGACGGLSQNFDYMGVSFPVDLDSVFCSPTALTMYQILSIGLLLVATWSAFRIAML